jgi:rhamnosyltransferase
MFNRPTILVILASYNGLKYIKEQIDSILTQEKVNVSLNIYDDCSNDGTLEFVVSEYSSNSGQIKIKKNNIPTGSAANNFFQALTNIDANEIEKYDFIAFADQDDIWLPNKLFEAEQKLRTENSNLYFSNLILWNQESKTKSLIKKSYQQKKYDYLFEGGSAGCTYVFTSFFGKELKKRLETINYKEWQFFSHDWLVYFFARLENYKVVIDENAYILYRVHDTNVHGQLNTFSLYAIKERLRLIKEGWYFKQSKGFVNLLYPDSDEYKIYKMYSKNYFTRIYVILRYNFSLIRSPKKAIQFFIISLLPLRINK